MSIEIVIIVVIVNEIEIFNHTSLNVEQSKTKVKLLSGRQNKRYLYT